MGEVQYDQEEFRDSVATISDEGKRNWIFPKKPVGNYYNWRARVSWVLLLFLFGAPFVRINGEPFMLLNVIERKFIIFGIVFWPQDFHLFFLAMITAIVGVVLFTVIYGRIFCGWICPQTIFMEMVFRRIEYWIDGDRGSQRKLARMDWNAEKIRKRLLKHSLFVIISIMISNAFLAYLVGSERLFELITDGPRAHLGNFVALLLFAGMFYFIFAWFREQVCIVACPYGRLQGVMLDKKSMVVAYDYVRGEGRAKFRKGEDRQAAGKGDCIDCNQCVDVCPTGIDIRHGTQLECINCTACMDACDAMMDKVGMPKGLIRYASEENIAQEKPWKFTTRTIAYTVVLTLMTSILTFFLITRSDIESIILRVPGKLYMTEDDGRISNLYNYKLINKKKEELEVDFKLISHEGEIMLIGLQEILVPAAGIKEGTFFLKIEPELLEGRKTRIKVGIFDEEGNLIDTFKTNFNGPVK
jgi:cytochrome c oxidase accessory protein FixG